MNYNSISGGQETLCVKVNKVYDWVTRQVEVPLLVFKDLSDLDFACTNGDAVGPSVDPFDVLTGKLTVECFPSDCNGHPIDPLAPGAIFCKEVHQADGRPTGHFQLPDGSTVQLQKVKVVKKGFVVVKVSDCNGNCCTSDALPWVLSEKFFLCAPPGTFLQCEITDFECDANLICKEVDGPPCGFVFQQLDISITLCQSVQMEAKVKLEITADFCQPRQDLPLICPPIAAPPQCPTIFPNTGNGGFND